MRPGRGCGVSYTINELTSSVAEFDLVLAVGEIDARVNVIRAVAAVLGGRLLKSLHNDGCPVVVFSAFHAASDIIS